MNEDEKKWQEQFWKNSGGVREVFRFGCAFAIWLWAGIGLTLWSENVGYMLICFGILFGFSMLTAIWQPAYLLLRKILGNENLPPKLLQHNYKWWNYIPLIIILVISAALIFKSIEVLTK